MSGMSWIRETAGQWIAVNRMSRAVALLHRFAFWVEQQYHNESGDSATNGEYDLLQKLQCEDFRIVIDVGANVGDWSVVAAQCWPSCRVHAFEIVPQIFADLQETVKISACQNITAVNNGLGNEQGKIQIHYYPEHPDLSCEGPRHNYHSIVVDATTTTLVDYCASAGIGIIDFLKIDVEGVEYKVLQGASALVDAGVIHCIQFEYGAFSLDTRFLLRDYYEMLGAGYWIGKIYPGYVDFRDYDWRMEDFRFCNYLCVSRSRPDLLDRLAL